MYRLPNILQSAIDIICKVRGTYIVITWASQRFCGWQQWIGIERELLLTCGK